jgi:predicted nucleotide-binding protein
MAKKKSTIEIQKTVLIKPREVFRKELIERIQLGEELKAKPIKTIPELETLEKDYGTWTDYNKELIKQAFNNQYSEYWHQYKEVNTLVGWRDAAFRVNTDHPSNKYKYAIERIDNCNTTMQRLVEKLPLIEQEGSIASYQTKDRTFYNRGFIVHGHNDARKLEVARYIENDLKRTAIILHEQANKGRTIIEKFEDHSTVDFAVALWTSDDEGKSKKENDLKDRARQNVIFETGFFIGKLGREKVVVLYEDEVEIPSDYSGVIFIRIADNWKDNLRKEIDAIYS